MRCVTCRKKNAKPCEQCKSTHYCSEDCQKLDWPIHESLCHSMKDLSDRPSEQHKLAFFFPEYEYSPKLIWVKVVNVETCDCADRFCIMTSLWHIRSYFGNDPSLHGLDDDEIHDKTGDYVHLCTQSVATNPRNGARSHSRQLLFNGLDDSDHHAEPQSLLSLAKENWMGLRGPVIVQAHVATENRECFAVGDIKLSDLIMVVDRVRAPNNFFREPTKMDDSGDKDDSEDSDSEDW